jgi:hypothetical protein
MVDLIDIKVKVKNKFRKSINYYEYHMFIKANKQDEFEEPLMSESELLEYIKKHESDYIKLSKNSKVKIRFVEKIHYDDGVRRCIFTYDLKK